MSFRVLRILSMFMHGNDLFKTGGRKDNLKKIIHVICEWTGSKTRTHHSSEHLSFWCVISLLSIKMKFYWNAGSYSDAPCCCTGFTRVQVTRVSLGSKLAPWLLLLLYLWKWVVSNLDLNIVRFDKWVLTWGLLLIGMSVTCCFS